MKDDRIYYWIGDIQVAAAAICGLYRGKYKMKWSIQKLSLYSRMWNIIHGLHWLTLVYLPSYDHDTKKWSIVKTSIRERIDCFLSCIETCICGYVYRLEEEKE